jgi:hypothetical protein
MKIPVDKIREVIGSGGKVIREIVEKTGAKVNIEDDGTIQIAARRQGDRSGDQDGSTRSRRAGSRRDLQGQGRQDRGLRRLRQLLRLEGRPRPHLAAHREMRPEASTDVVKEGDKVWVKLLGFDDRGKVRLSMKIVDQETGKEIADTHPSRFPIRLARPLRENRPLALWSSSHSCPSAGAQFYQTHQVFWPFRVRLAFRLHDCRSSRH